MIAIDKNRIKKILSERNLIATMKRVMSNSSVQKVIIETIKSRLYNEGVDSWDEKLKTDFGRSQGTSSGYSRKTEQKKRANKVTLFDTGEMFDSIFAKVKQEALFVDADFDKGKSNIFDNFQDMYYSESLMKERIFGLSESDFEAVKREILLKSFEDDLRGQLKNM